jgi:hypothetical protein
MPGWAEAGLLLNGSCNYFSWVFMRFCRNAASVAMNKHHNTCLLCHVCGPHIQLQDALPQNQFAVDRRKHHAQMHLYACQAMPSMKVKVMQNHWQSSS